jgi:hypothetical protein
MIRHNAIVNYLKFLCKNNSRTEEKSLGFFVSSQHDRR